MIEHDQDFHGGCHPFIEVEPGFYLRLDPNKGKVWVVNSVKEHLRHPQAYCQYKEIWEKAFDRRHHS